MNDVGNKACDQTVEEKTGLAAANATFSAPGEYVLRLQANDATGDGGGGFQCCWTTAYIKAVIKAGPTGK